MVLPAGPDFRLPPPIEDYDIDRDVVNYIYATMYREYQRDLWNCLFFGERWHEYDDGDTIIRGEN